MIARALNKWVLVNAYFSFVIVFQMSQNLAWLQISREIFHFILSLDIEHYELHGFLCYLCFIHSLIGSLSYLIINDSIYIYIVCYGEHAISYRLYRRKVSKHCGTLIDFNYYNSGLYLEFKWIPIPMKRKVY